MCHGWPPPSHDRMHECMHPGVSETEPPPSRPVSPPLPPRRGQPTPPGRPGDVRMPGRGPRDLCVCLPDGARKGVSLAAIHRRSDALGSVIHPPPVAPETPLCPRRARGSGALVAGTGRGRAYGEEEHNHGRRLCLCPVGPGAELLGGPAAPPCVCPPERSRGHGRAANPARQVRYISLQPRHGERFGPWAWWPPFPRRPTTTTSVSIRRSPRTSN